MKCVVCLIKEPLMKDVKPALCIVNGHSVCRDHVESVMSEQGVSSVVIGKTRETT